MNYKQRTEEIFSRADQYKKTRRKKIAAAATGIGLSAVIACSAVLFAPYSLFLPDVSKYGDSEYYSLIQTLNVLTNSSEYKNNWEKWKDSFFSLNKGWGSDENDGISSPTANGGYQETTDNQVNGVIEGDLFKRSDKYIFYLSSAVDVSDGYYRTEYRFLLNVYSIEGGNSQRITSFSVQNEQNFCVYREYTTNAEMYLSEDCNTVTIISNVYDKQNNSVCTAVMPLDVSDVTDIKQGETGYVSGSYVSSRYTDGKLLTVSNFTVRPSPDFSDEAQYLPQAGTKEHMQSLPMSEIILPDGARAARYTVLCAFENGRVVSHTAFLSYAQGVYVSENNAYVTRMEEREGDRATVTEIARVSYADGLLEYKGCVRVEGSVLNQYSLDEKEGVLRVVTTLPRTAKQATNVSLYCVNIDTFEMLAKLERFAPDGERVRSVRFDGDKVSVCTSIEMTDPVFIIDLSDLQNIKVKDTGVIGGYSVALRQFKDGTLLGIGYDEAFRLKIELYAETEDGVESLAADVRAAYFSTQYKSYFIDAENGYIGLCVYEYQMQTVQRTYSYLLLRYDGESLTEVLCAPMQTAETDLARACLADGYLYVLSDCDFFPVKL